MHYRNLGATGLAVSALALGTMTFGREADEASSYAMLDAFAEAGGTLIDTADVYGAGVSEEILGNWLQTRRRDDVVVATKVRWGTETGPNKSGLGRKHVIAAVEASLRRLGTDYIDLYQIHMWDNQTRFEEIVATLDLLVTSGKVRYLGASNVAPGQLQKAVSLSRAMGQESFVALQPLYNLLDREAEWELLPICRAEGLGVIPWSPLRAGWLTGKFHRDMAAPAQDTRYFETGADEWDKVWKASDNKVTWNTIDAQLAIADELERPPAQVALNWLLAQPGVTAPIVGARSLSQLSANLGCIEWSLTPDQTSRLTAASTRPLPYPYSFINGR